MTIKKIGLSAIAIAALSSLAFAGTISTTTAGKLGTEKLSLGDLNVSEITQSAVYTPTTIPAGSLKNPIFKFALKNAKSILPSAGAVSVFEVVDGNESNTSNGNYREVANNPVVTGANGEVVSFSAKDGSIYVYNDKEYVIRLAATPEDLTSPVQATVVKGLTSNVTMSATLYSGDSQNLIDETPEAILYTVGKEYTATIVRPFDARIDAAASFQTFYDQNSDLGVKKADDIEILVKRDAVIKVGSGTLNTDVAKYSIYPDQNLTQNALASVATTNATVTAAAFDNNISGNISSIAAKSAVVTLTVDGTSKIEKTNFGVDVWVASGTTKFPLITKTTKNAGSWDIYGYNAQIPNVSGLSTHDVTMKFTNRSSLDTNIYFTLIDPDGTIATLNSVDNKLAALKKDVTGTYKASALIALITDPNFNSTSSFSVEVSIPTTPSSVYGMASFKNTILGQFKDLPVYNSSDMTY